MQPKILLFDFDGTIADTLDSAVRIYNEIAQENGYTIVSKDALAAMRNMSAMENVRYLGISILKVPFIAKQVRAMLKHEVPDLKPFEGIVEPLRALKAKGRRLYIVSSNSTENIQAFLDHHQIDVFDDVYSVSNLFGKHMAISGLLEANHWDPASVMYVGDEARDIEAAKRAGITVAAVLWGYNTEEVLLKNTPDILLRSPSELSGL